MGSFQYVLRTWWIAQMLHPLVSYFYGGVTENSWMPDLGMAVVLFLFGFLFTIFSFLLCLAFFAFIKWCRIAAALQFSLWIALSVLSVMLGVYITSSVFFQGVDFLWDGSSDLMFPGYAAAVISIIIRYKEFLPAIGKPATTIN